MYEYDDVGIGMSEEEVQKLQVKQVCSIVLTMYRSRSLGVRRT